jgi:menaquinone-dependent protoporphyrinogen oxidase
MSKNNLRGLYESIGTQEEKGDNRMVTKVRQAGVRDVAGGKITGVPRTIMVGYATRYGSTAEIADIIAEELRALGYIVDCVPLQKARSGPEGYDAAVLGSPLYMGKWLAEAREYVSRERVALGKIPVAVFSVGYTFRDQSPPVIQAGCDALSDVTGFIPVRDHAFFTGKVDMEKVSAADRAILSLAKVTPGDFRNEDMVRAYARRLPQILGL